MSTRGQQVCEATGPELLAVTEALARIEAALAPIADRETIGLGVFPKGFQR